MIEKIFSLDVPKKIQTRLTDSDTKQILNVFCKSFHVVRPASLNHPKNNAVMFITESFIDKSDVFRDCYECIVF